MMTITESAIAKIAEVLEAEPAGSKLRIYIHGGGCAGFSYGFTIDSEKAEDDFELPAGSSFILVDSMSAQYVEGATIDYVEELMGASFKIKNPKASSTCGCGSSFSPF